MYYFAGYTLEPYQDRYYQKLNLTLTQQLADFTQPSKLSIYIPRYWNHEQVHEILAGLFPRESLPPKLELSKRFRYSKLSHRLHSNQGHHSLEVRVDSWQGKFHKAQILKPLSLPVTLSSEVIEQRLERLSNATALPSFEELLSYFPEHNGVDICWELKSNRGKHTLTVEEETHRGRFMCKTLLGTVELTKDLSPDEVENKLQTLLSQTPRPSKQQFHAFFTPAPNGSRSLVEGRENQDHLKNYL